MRFSSSYIPTLKDTPQDAEVVSHKLLLRAGMVRRVASGIYAYLPLGLRILDKISRVVREEMDRAGFNEISMPMAQPGDLWKESGRWEHYGKELLRFKDRNERDYCLGPTHEEVINDLIRTEKKSYRSLPVRLYQIQSKFRDEIRPRFGLMRAREFLMKDAYSFDADDAGADKSYALMYEAYNRIFRRLGLRFRPVEADSGSIGGNFSHEFMVLANTGEDEIAVCDNCGYAANVERAELREQENIFSGECPPVVEVSTPGAHTVGQVTALLNKAPENLIKTMIFLADDRPIAALVRGDREINELKLKKVLGADKIELAPAGVVAELTHAPVGYAGPVGLEIPIYGDNELKEGGCWITGANKGDAHLANVNLARDVKVEKWADLRTAQAGDKCPKCGKPLAITRGIEVGHVFKLGDKYSSPLGVCYADEHGQERPIVEGCYGIGISRVAAAAIEQNHDAAGIIFPPQISPYSVMLLNLDPARPEVTRIAEDIYERLQAAGEDVLYDDRNERPGVKFNDADLLGFPMRITIGGKGVARGVAECKDRRTGESLDLPLDDFMDAFSAWKAKVLHGWENR